ncbi:BTAD domain-containing putative transcriptional regulator [Nonomuraea sp. NPDC049625]|uniref:AfsR/SARP family transcriptional regulator n=1 Tax=Nonomuraea sp. NPDC049625 TaxID=3155775 RepID=UPI00341DFA2C
MVVRFRVLGPLEVVRDGGAPIRLLSGMQRIALATLLLYPNQPVVADGLIERMWGDDTPDDPRGALHTHLTRLRRTLSKDLIESSGGGYLLRADEDSLDLINFRDLVARGRRDGAAEKSLLTQALALWRGPALANVDSDALHRDEVAALEEEHRHAQERWFELALRAGEGPAIISRLKAAVVASPMSERLSGQLMIALYQAGRQAEALEVYEGLRVTLRDELGLEPGQGIRQAHAQVLSQDVPRLGGDLPGDREQVAVAHVPVPAELPAKVATFTGRHHQAQALLDSLRDGRATVAAISGPGGIGKSALALHVAHRLAAGFPDGQLYLDLNGSTSDVPPLEPAQALRRLLRSLGVVPAAVSAEPGEAARLLRSLTAGRRMLFLLDNVRDVAQVRDLLPGGAGCRVLLTSRRLLADLDGAEHVQLDVFSPEESYELLERLVGGARLAAEPQAAAQVVRHCGGLPLAVHIAATRLVSRPAWPISVLADRLAAQHRRMNELSAGDRAIRATFTTSYQQLQTERHGAAATRVFDLLGLFDGADLGTDTVAALAGLPAERAWELLELLADVRLLQTHEPGRYRMHHLARLFARERAAARGPDALQAVRRVLHHFLATARRAVRLLNPHPEWPVAVAPLAAVHAGSQLAGPRAAREWADAEAPNLVAVVRQAAESGDDGLTIGLASSFSHLMLDRGRWDQVRQIRRVAAHVLQHPAAERAGLGVPLSSRAHLAVASRVLMPDKASLG